MKISIVSHYSWGEPVKGKRLPVEQVKQELNRILYVVNHKLETSAYFYNPSAATKYAYTSILKPIEGQYTYRARSCRTGRRVWGMCYCFYMAFFTALYTRWPESKVRTKLADWNNVKDYVDYVLDHNNARVCDCPDDTFNDLVQEVQELQDNRVTGPANALRQAKELIQDPHHWSTMALARDSTGYPVRPSSDSAVQWCALGALEKAAGKTTIYKNAHLALRDAAFETAGECLLSVLNDNFGHTAVMQAYEKAIETSERKYLKW